MAGKDDAFVRVSCKCPVCTRESRHRYVKSKLYQPLEIEPDQHVVAYKWESPRYEGIRPNFYHIWCCPTCSFCDEKEVWRGDDDSGGRLELIRDKLLIAAKAPKSINRRLGGVIDFKQEFVCLESALAAHLLAIYIQEMLTPNMRQYAKLGRFYLRTAWLYREKSSWNVPETNIPDGYGNYAEFFESLKPEWPAILLNEEDAINKAIECYHRELDQNSRVDDVRYEISVMFLLVNLHRRMDDLDNAAKLVRGVFQQATRKRQAARHALDNSVNRKSVTAQKLESMRSLITWLNNTVDRANGMYEEINEEIFQREFPKARDLVLALPDPTPQNVLAKLREEKFHAITCKKVAILFSKKLIAEGKSLDDARQAEEDLAQAEAEEKEKQGFWGKIMDRFKKDDE